MASSISDKAFMDVVGLTGISPDELLRHMGTFDIQTNDPKLRRKMNVPEGAPSVGGKMRVITDDTGRHQTIGRFLGVNAGDMDPVHEAVITEPGGRMLNVPIDRLSDQDAVRAVRSERNPRNLPSSPTPESRIRSVRAGARITPPADPQMLSAQDAEARYRAAGMDPEAAKVVAEAEAKIHGDGAQAIWSQSPSVESLDRVRGIRDRQASTDRRAKEATQEPFVARGLPLPGEEQGEEKHLYGIPGALAYRDRKGAETEERMRANLQWMKEADAREYARQKRRQAEIAALSPQERREFAERAIAGGTQIQFGMSDTQRANARRRVLTEAWKKYGKAASSVDKDGNQIGLGYEDFANAYDKVLRETGSHGKATMALNSMLEPIKADLARQNHETGRQRAKDYNLARETGRPIGDIMFQNDLANQQGNPAGERAVLVGQHASRPGLGLGNLAALGMKGEQDLAAVQAAGGNRNRNPIERMREGAAEVRNAPVEDKILAARTHVRGMNPGGQVDVQTENQSVVQMLGQDAQRVVLNPNRSPADMMFLQQWTHAHSGSGLGGADVKSKYRDWCRQLGVPENQQTAGMYYQLTGENPLGIMERFSNSLENLLFGQPQAVAAPPAAQAQE